MNRSSVVDLSCPLLCERLSGCIAHTAASEAAIHCGMVLLLVH